MFPRLVLLPSFLPTPSSILYTPSPILYTPCFMQVIFDQSTSALNLKAFPSLERIIQRWGRERVAQVSRPSPALYIRPLLSPSLSSRVFSLSKRSLCPFTIPSSPATS